MVGSAMAKILSGARVQLAGVVDPVARALLRAGISPDAVTVAGAVGVIVAAVGFAVRGQFLIATVIATFAALTDLLDGAMARARGRSSTFGAFLDSTMDRVADGVIFAALAYWHATTGRHWTAVAALLCLVTSQLVSYVRARAEGLGLTANVGLVERPERLISVGVAGLLQGFDVPYGMATVLWVLGVLSAFTVVQRIVHVYRQTNRADEASAREASAREAARGDGGEGTG
jgi:CDP-diacylglycerol---glycerol-3-phosphate 3-phosphatidyltransferase